MQNPYVAYTVDEDDPDWFNIQALQIEGKASIITDEGELREAGEILVAKFPVAADMPPDPDSIMIKIEPEVIYYLDYSVKLGYREQVNLWNPYLIFYKILLKIIALYLDMIFFRSYEEILSSSNKTLLKFMSNRTK